MDNQEANTQTCVDILTFQCLGYQALHETKNFVSQLIEMEQRDKVTYHFSSNDRSHYVLFSNIR